MERKDHDSGQIATPPSDPAVTTSQSYTGPTPTEVIRTAELLAGVQLRNALSRYDSRALAVGCTNFGFTIPATQSEMVDLIVRAAVSRLFYRELETSGCESSAPAKLKCICNGSFPPADTSLVECTVCHSLQHSSCMDANRSLNPYRCPACLISLLDPLMLVSGFALQPFLVPTQLVETQLDLYPCSFTIPFMTGPAVRAYVRCIRLDGESSEHVWPFYGQLRVNEGSPTIFALPAHNHPHRYNDSPQPIPLSPVSQLNVISLTRIRCKSHQATAAMRADAKFNYVAAVVLAEELSTEQLQSRVVAGRSPSVLASRGRFLEGLKRVFSEDDDCVCEEKSIRLSLEDPYLPQRLLTIPCYGERCEHLQSFDLTTYIVMNQRVKYWKCPICSKRALEPVVDTHLRALLEVLREHRISCRQVGVDRDGRFAVSGDLAIIFDDKVGAFRIGFREPLPAKVLEPIDTTEKKQQQSRGRSYYRTLMLEMEAQLRDRAVEMLSGLHRGAETRLPNWVPLDVCRSLARINSAAGRRKRLHCENDGIGIRYGVDNDLAAAASNWTKHTGTDLASRRKNGEFALPQIGYLQRRTKTKAVNGNSISN